MADQSICNHSDMPSKGPIGEITVISDQNVEWKIDDIFSYTGKNQSYHSPILILSNYKWRLSIYPNGNGKGGSAEEGWISLYLHPLDLPWRRGVAYSFGVKKCDGKIENFKSNITWIFEHKVGYGCDKYLKRSELSERKSELAPSDTFTITCTFLRVCDDFNCIGQTSSLSENFLEMFKSEKACDATLQVEQKKFSVHKCVLMARSPVFAAMFETPMKEKATGGVHIEDCDPEVFREFLVYLYSGRFEKLSRHIIELYKLADKYIVQDLKIDCVLALMDNLSVENVTDAVSFAERSNEVDLRLLAQAFFNGNYIEILLSSKWETFMKEEQELAHKLLQILARNHSIISKMKKSSPRRALGQSEQGNRLGQSGQGNRLGQSGQGNRLGQNEQGNRLGQNEQGNRLGQNEQGNRLGQNEQGLGPRAFRGLATGLDCVELVLTVLLFFLIIIFVCYFFGQHKNNSVKIYSEIII